MNSFITGDRFILIGIVDPTNWQRTNCVPSRPLRAQGRGRGYVRAPLDAAHLSQTQRNGTSRQGKLWRLLRVAPRTKNDPGASCVPRPLVSELPAGGHGASRPAEVLALGYWVGRESSLRPGAFARLACCGRPLPASRAAQPWSSRVPAWVVAIGSCKICGNA